MEMRRQMMGQSGMMGGLGPGMVMNAMGGIMLKYAQRAHPAK